MLVAYPHGKAITVCFFFLILKVIKLNLFGDTAFEIPTHKNDKC